MAPSPSQTRSTLVFVDRESDRRAALERTSGRALDIVCVSNARAAIDVFERHPVAVLVTALHDADDLLRAVGERSPRTFRIVTSVQDDIDRMLNMRDEGLVASYLVSPWREDELEQLLRWACDAWSLTGDVVALPRAQASAPRPADLIHDLKSPLMTMLANAEHLEELSTSVPMLTEALACVSLAPEHRRLLAQILEDLQPISEELTTATRRLAQIAEQLHAVGEPARESRRRRSGSK